MSIRTKVFALAGVLLLLFASVVGVLAMLRRSVVDNLGDIAAYHRPLMRLLSDVDASAFEYELLVERLRRDPDRDQADLRRAAERIATVAARLREDFARFRTTLDGAIDYNAHDPHDLLGLARMQGAMRYIHRQVDPFLAVGREATEAILAGRPEEAHAKVRGFAAFEDAFGSDLDAVRDDLAALNDNAVALIFASHRLHAWLSGALLLIALGVGVGVSVVGSSRVTGGLRSLLDSVGAVEAGRTDVAVPVLTRDEVGELALAFNRMVEGLRERERIRDTFGKFVDPRIVARLVGASDGAPDQADRKVATIFFSDIRGFSAICERLTASAMVRLLNVYFSAVAEEIRRRNGIIDKYIGDSVMAFWCAPFSAGDAHAADGCLAALAQLKAVEAVRGRLPEITGLRRDAPELVVRMGVATGDAVVGAIGSPAARSYTAIGDTVNLASRLEGVNKVYGTSILVAEDTYRLARHAVEAREIDVVAVAGKSEPVRIFELLAEADGLDPVLAELRELFAPGLDAYRRRDWEGASSHFEACRRLVPGDGPSGVYLERVARLRAAPPPADWNGVWRLESK